MKGATIPYRPSSSCNNTAAAAANLSHLNGSGSLGSNASSSSSSSSSSSVDSNCSSRAMSTPAPAALASSSFLPPSADLAGQPQQPAPTPAFLYNNVAAATDPLLLQVNQYSTSSASTTVSTTPLSSPTTAATSNQLGLGGLLGAAAQQQQQQYCPQQPVTSGSGLNAEADCFPPNATLAAASRPLVQQPSTYHDATTPFCPATGAADPATLLAYANNNNSIPLLFAPPPPPGSDQQVPTAASEILDPCSYFRGGPQQATTTTMQAGDLYNNGCNWFMPAATAMGAGFYTGTPATPPQVSPVIVSPTPTLPPPQPQPQHLKGQDGADQAQQAFLAATPGYAQTPAIVDVSIRV